MGRYNRDCRGDAIRPLTTGKLRDRDRYDPLSDRWEIVSAMGAPRSTLQAVCVNRGQVSVFDRWIAEADRRMCSLVQFPSADISYTRVYGSFNWYICLVQNLVENSIIGMSIVYGMELIPSIHNMGVNLRKM